MPSHVAAHLGPVLDGVADVGEHAAQVRGDRLSAPRSALAVDLEVHPRLDVPSPNSPVWPIGVDVEDLLQLAGGVAADDELRVHDQVDGALLPRTARR